MTMGHGWYNTVQPMGYRMVRVLYGPWVMGGTTLYGPWVMESYIVVQRCMAHGSWVMGKKSLKGLEAEADGSGDESDEDDGSGEENRWNGYGEAGPGDLNPDSSGGTDEDCELTSNR